jgi:fatty acid/phospholipid biosynthesis enzyme
MNKPADISAPVLPADTHPSASPFFTASAILTTIDGKGFVFLDVGANADAKPEHLLQYAQLGNIYAGSVPIFNNDTLGF